MLGNRHPYPGAEEEEDEEEEEEEEMEEDERDVDQEEEENGELDGEEEDEEEEVVEEVRRGGLSRVGRGEGHRQPGKPTGRPPGDRQIRSGNPGHATNPYSSNPAPTHQPPANHVQQQPQRRLKERNTGTTSSEDAHVAMMVFRIGIPDIKQTVSAFTRHTDTADDEFTNTANVPKYATRKRFVRTLPEDLGGLSVTLHTMMIGWVGPIII